MRKTLSGITILFVLFALAPRVTAGTPYLQVYFDNGFLHTWGDCPAQPIGTVAQMIYVVAHNFDAWLNAIEYRLDLPPQLLFLGDMPSPGSLSIGNSPEGIAIAFPVPLNAYSPVLISTVSVLWMCDNCFPPNQDRLICFDVYPSSGYLRAVRWPDLSLIYATAGTARICGSSPPLPKCAELPIPVERTTWGHIKAMYQ
jgi:hypothetical protein